MYAIQSGAPMITRDAAYNSRVPLILNIRSGDVTEVTITPRLVSNLVALLCDVHPPGIITFDFETTGLDTTNDRITEYAFYHTQLRTTIAHSLVNPQMQVPLEV